MLLFRARYFTALTSVLLMAGLGAVVADGQAKTVAAQDFKEPLVDAADHNYGAKVQELLKNGHPVNATSEFETTALMRAAYRGYAEIVDSLLKAGADANKKDIGGATALSLAVREGHKDVVQSLLKGGASANVSDKQGWTPLMRAANLKDPEVTRILLQAGANVKAENDSKETALTQAVRSGNVDVATELLDRGAPSEKALELAKKRNAAPMIKLLSDRQAPSPLESKSVDAYKGLESSEEPMISKVPAVTSNEGASKQEMLPSADQFYVLQLGLLGSESEALDLKNKLLKEHGDLLKDLSFDVTKTQLGVDQAEAYHLRASGFAKEEDARSRCAKLALHDVDCLVIEKAVDVAKAPVTSNQIEMKSTQRPVVGSSSEMDRKEQEVVLSAPVSSPIPLHPQESDQSKAPMASVGSAPEPSNMNELFDTDSPTAISNSPMEMPLPENPPVVPMIKKDKEVIVPNNDISKDIISTRPGLGVSEAVQVPVRSPVEVVAPSPVMKHSDDEVQMWAEIGSFDTSEEARQFWSQYSQKIGGAAQLSMRQISPLNSRNSAERTVIQVGPFDTKDGLESFCKKAERDRDVSYCEPVAPVIQNTLYREAEVMNRQVIRYGGRNSQADSRYYTNNQAQQTAGIWVQLGSFATQQIAEDRYAQLKGQAQGVLDFVDSNISPSSFINGAKSSYRLRVGPFGTIQEASGTCDQLRSKSILCLVIQK